MDDKKFANLYTLEKLTTYKKKKKLKNIKLKLIYLLIIKNIKISLPFLRTAKINYCKIKFPKQYMTLNLYRN
jgi:hypothetical protein